jgi:Zn-dependent protease
VGRHKVEDGVDPVEATPKLAPMDEPPALPPSAPPPVPPGGELPLRVDPPRPSWGERIKKTLGPVGAAIVLVFTKLKFLVLPVLKFLPLILKTGGTMILSLWVYAQMWGWKFAAGFVLLIFIHECGHLIVAKKFGLKVSAPMFIPFLGAFIALKEAPRDAWMEACVGIGGPLLGTLGTAVCYALFWPTENPLFLAVAYSGSFLNLFNLVPIGQLDGGRVATALSPWLWVVGLAIAVAMLFHHLNFLLVLIVIMSLPQVFSLFRKRSEVEKRYFEVAPARRVVMAVLYFGLVATLVAGMYSSQALLRR